jgi:hypothetical protein
MKKILAMTLLGLLLASLAQAFQFQVTDEIKGSLDTQATAGAGVRLNDPKPNMVGDPRFNPNANTAQWANGDDGNLNYRKGDPFATYLKLTPELLLQLPERFKFMARGTLLYDFMATETARSPLPDASKSQVARDYRLLDLWVSKEFTLGDNTARVRVGNQVISWGESVFALGGINQANSLDLQKLMIPGTQLKEAVLPAPMISFSTGLGKGVNVEAYYQWDWNRNRVPPVGTYWSIADIYDKGRSPIFLNPANTNFGGLDNFASSGPGTHDTLSNLVATGFAAVPATIDIPFAPDRTPNDQGQFGIAVHYKPEGLQMDLGLYFMNYHDKMPVLGFTDDFRGQWNFLENRQMYGVSANMPVGNWAMGWELSYRPKEAVALSAPGTLLADGTVDTSPFLPDGAKQWADTEKYQSHLTGLLMLTPGDHGWLLNLLGADSGVFLGEAVGIYFPNLQKVYNTGGTRLNLVTGLPEATVQVPAAGYMSWLANTSTPGPSGATQTVPGVGSKWSGGYTIDFNWTYDGSVIPGWQVTPGVTFFHAIAGDTPTMTFNYAAGAKSTNAYILFNMNPAKWQCGINYAKFFGGAGGDGGGSSNLRQPLADRDFVGGFVTYNF